MTVAKTVAGLTCYYDPFGRGYVDFGGRHVPEEWTDSGNAVHNRENDMRDCIIRTRLPRFEDFQGVRYVRSAQNHRSTILFVDGYGITIARKTEIVEIPYDQLSCYQMSADGIEWMPVCSTSHSR